MLPMVVAERLFVHVTKQMKRLDRYICSIQAALQQGPEVFNAVGVDVIFYVAFKMIHYLVEVAIFQIVVASEFVGVDFGSRLYKLAHDLFRDVLFATRNHGSFHLAAALQQAHHNGLTVSALHSDTITETAALRLIHVPSLAADEGLIYFDRGAIAAELG